MNENVVSLLCVGTLLLGLFVGVVALTWGKDEIVAGLRRWVDGR